MKLQGTKENEFDEKMVIFLKNYTLNTIKNIKGARRGEYSGKGLVNTLLRNKKEAKIDDSKYFDLNKFWLIF